MNQKAMLPDAQEMKDWLLSSQRKAVLDDDGCIRLEDLTNEARRIVESAHAMAQQCGVRSIPTRLLFAAFLSDKQGSAIKFSEDRQVNAELLSELLIAATERQAPESFLLGLEASERIVWPMLSRARELSEGNAVSEEVLFRAFRETAPDEFKELLRALPKPLHLDLDPATSKGPLNRDEFDKQAWGAIQMAANWARVQGYEYVRTPHLYAALIGDGHTPLGKILYDAGLEPEGIKASILCICPPQQGSVGQDVQLSPNVHAFLQRATKMARLAKRRIASLEDILTSVLDDGGGVVGEQLKANGIDLVARWKLKSRRESHNEDGHR